MDLSLLSPSWKIGDVGDGMQPGIRCSTALRQKKRSGSRGERGRRGRETCCKFNITFFHFVLVLSS